MDENEVIASHNDWYRMVETAPFRRVEHRVIGCDYGAAGSTTRAQADLLGRLLELRPGKTFLDVGSGAGWPGIYLAATTGARVLLTDIPEEGRHIASRRLRHEGIDGSVVAASGAALPFRDSTFDAVTHTDVLC
jgi:cyclopropane fatty-acyl-phospholipid synthase-like methyltransferase